MEWEGVESSVDKEVIQRVNEYEEICRKHNVSIDKNYLALIYMVFLVKFPRFAFSISYVAKFNVI